MFLLNMFNSPSINPITERNPCHFPCRSNIEKKSNGNYPQQNDETKGRLNPECKIYHISAKAQYVTRAQRKRHLRPGSINFMCNQRRCDLNPGGTRRRRNSRLRRNKAHTASLPARSCRNDQGAWHVLIWTWSSENATWILEVKIFSTTQRRYATYILTNPARKWGTDRAVQTPLNSITHGDQSYGTLITV